MREHLDARITDGQKVNTGTYCRLANSTNRLASTLGLKRVPKDATVPSLGEYLKATYAREAEEVQTEDVDA